MKTENPIYTISVPPRSVGEAIHKAIVELLSGEPRERVILYAGSMGFVTPAEICGLRMTIDCAASVAERRRR